MRDLLKVGACALALAGCQTVAEGTAPSEPAPSNYRQLAAAHVRASFNDPYTISDAEIAPPKLAMGPSLNADGFKTPWVVCIRANAKNRMGAYTGRTMTAIAMSGGKVVNSWDEAHAAGMLCADARYEPFPEIEEKRR